MIMKQQQGVLVCALGPKTLSHQIKGWRRGCPKVLDGTLMGSTSFPTLGVNHDAGGWDSGSSSIFFLLCQATILLILPPPPHPEGAPPPNKPTGDTPSFFPGLWVIRGKITFQGAGGGEGLSRRSRPQPPAPTWSGPVLSAVCPSGLQALRPPSLGMSGIPPKLASTLPKTSPSPQGIHQLRPFRNALTPGTTRARKSHLIPRRIHHSSQRKSLQPAGEASCPDLPLWAG